MKRILDYLTIILCFILLLGIPLMYIIGIRHCKKFHTQTDYYFSYFPPIGIYRGFESFFHEPEDTAIEKREKNWDTYVLVELKSIQALLDETANLKRDQIWINENSKLLAQNIAQIPSEMKNKVQYPVTLYMNFHEPLLIDQQNILESWYLGKTLKLNLSKETQEFASQLRSQRYDFNVDIVLSGVDEAYSTFNSSLLSNDGISSISEETFKLTANKLLTSFKKTFEEQKAIYKMLFETDYQSFVSNHN